jgi:hypothetical protein
VATRDDKVAPVLGVVVDMPPDVRRALARVAAWFLKDGKLPARTFSVAGCAVRVARAEQKGER